MPGIATVHGLGQGKSLGSQYNTAIPHLIGTWLPSGMLGIAITGLMAAFMAGVAANVTAFNTVVTYDLVQSYWKMWRRAIAWGGFWSLVASTAAAYLVNRLNAYGIIFAALMIFWALARPVMPEPRETLGQDSGRLRRAPAT